MPRDYDAHNDTQNFITGFIAGAIISGGACYLTLTKSGRKLARELLRKAEEMGEEGYEIMEGMRDPRSYFRVEGKTSKKIENIIGLLRGQVGSLKKG